MILTEDLKPISPQEAKDRNLFGPVYHGSTSDKLEKISTQGFKINVGRERFGDISHGYEISDYWGGIPAPIHHLGFGVYFTTVKSIAKQFSYSNSKIGPYFLDVPNILTINFGSPRTMMKWWLENGYDYDKNKFLIWNTDEIRTDTQIELIRKERLKATLNLTNNLKSKYDAVWFKGKGIHRLLDGDQVVVFDPSRIYKLDKSLTKPGEIGSKVVSKVGIDPYGRGEIKIPVGTKGIIIDKIKPTEFQKWAEGSEWLYSIKWEPGGVMRNVIDQWIEPYERKKLKEYIIQRRGFWKEYEKVYNENSILKEEFSKIPISKMEEDYTFNYICNHIWGLEYPELKKTIKKSRRTSNEIQYTSTVGGLQYIIYVKKDVDGEITIQAKNIDTGELSISYELPNLKENNLKRNSVYIKDNWKEGDEEHAEALAKTGYWGRQGAGAIILSQSTGRILLPFRSRYVEQPHTWGVWGGAIDENENPPIAVKREIQEEVGYAGPLELIPLYVFEDPRVGFRYSNFLAIVPEEFTPHRQWETEKSEWFKFGNWPSPLHFGLKALLQHSGNKILQNVKNL